MHGYWGRLVGLGLENIGYQNIKKKHLKAQRPVIIYRTKMEHPGDDNSPRQPNNADNAKINDPKHQLEEEQQQSSCKWYVVSWIIMLIAAAIYIGIFFLSHKAVPITWSNYYSRDAKVSPYITAEGSQLCSASITQTANDLYPNGGFRTAKAVALSLIFTWAMWKLPLLVFTLSLIWHNESKGIKFGTWGVFVIIMLAIDILLSIFVEKVYSDYIFYGAYALLTLIVAAVNNKDRVKQGLAAAFFPLAYIALVIFTYTYLWPALYDVYIRKIPKSAVYAQIYLYPLWDAIGYILLLTMNSKLPEMAKKFLSYIQFLILGYFVGMTLLVGVTEVQFYFLVSYMLFRNFFANWVMWRWEGVVNNPPCLPVWILGYYLSYAFNFLPIYGLGSLIVSKSFNTQQFSQTCMILYYFPTSQYPYNTETPINDYNYKMRGYILWVGALIIWGISTATQKYPRRKPNGFDFFFSLLGIYLFYVGISAGLQLPILSQVAFK